MTDTKVYGESQKIENGEKLKEIDGIFIINGPIRESFYNSLGETVTLTGYPWKAHGEIGNETSISIKVRITEIEAPEEGSGESAEWFFTGVMVDGTKVVGRWKPYAAAPCGKIKIKKSF